MAHSIINIKKASPFLYIFVKKLLEESESVLDKLRPSA